MKLFIKKFTSHSCVVLLFFLPILSVVHAPMSYLNMQRSAVDTQRGQKTGPHQETQYCFYFFSGVQESCPRSRSQSTHRRYTAQAEHKMFFCDSVLQMCRCVNRSSSCKLCCHQNQTLELQQLKLCQGFKCNCQRQHGEFLTCIMIPHSDSSYNPDRSHQVGSAFSAYAA